MKSLANQHSEMYARDNVVFEDALKSIIKRRPVYDEINREATPDQMHEAANSCHSQRT